MAKEKPESGRMWGGDIGKLLTKDWQKQQLQKARQLLANGAEPFGGRNSRKRGEFIQGKKKTNKNKTVRRCSQAFFGHLSLTQVHFFFCSVTSCTDTKHADERLICHFHHRSQRLRDTETCTSLPATSCELTHP